MFFDWALSLIFQIADSTGTTPSFQTTVLHITGNGLPASTENFTPLRLVFTLLNSSTTEGFNCRTASTFLPRTSKVVFITSAQGLPMFGVPNITRCATCGRPSGGVGLRVFV